MNNRKNDKKRYIGLCLSKLNEYIPNDFVHAVIKRAVEYGYTVLIYNAFSDFYFSTDYDIGESNIFETIKYEILDGLIVMSETIKDENILNNIILKAKEHGIYTVCVDKRIEGCYNIEFNYRSAFSAIVRHVVEKHGCRTINLVAGFKDNIFSEERIQCCRKVLEEHGIELDPRRIMYGDFWSEPTAKAFDEFMLSGLEMPEAFICCNDSMAIAICSKLKEYGYSIPGDVIVTGFDGIWEEQYHIPRLTTAKQDMELAGEKAVDAVVAHLDGRDFDNFCCIDHKVVWSHSCGCKPIDYREATGQIAPLFRLSDGDNSYDSFMSDFCMFSSSADNISDLSEYVYKYSGNYGCYYYAVSLNENFMNIKDDSEVIGEKSNNKYSKNRLILCERYNAQNSKPYYAEKLSLFEQAAKEYNAFIFWPVHFQEKSIGYAVSAISTGCDGMYKNADFRSMRKYSRNLNHVLEIANNNYMMKKMIMRLKNLYIHDHTGLLNRRGFYAQIPELISKYSGRRYLIIISVDMDGLKSINDNYGHAEGDVAINAIAQALISIWGENEICSRFGGDEFIAASICMTDPVEQSETLSKGIKKYLDDFNLTSGKPYTVHASLGINHELIDGDFSVDSLIKKADDLMYREKASHKESRLASANHSENQ